MAITAKNYASFIDLPYVADIFFCRLYFSRRAFVRPSLLACNVLSIGIVWKLSRIQFNTLSCPCWNKFNGCFFPEYSTAKATTGCDLLVGLLTFASNVDGFPLLLCNFRVKCAVAGKVETYVAQTDNISSSCIVDLQWQVFLINLNFSKLGCACNCSVVEVWIVVAQLWHSDRSEIWILFLTVAVN